MHRCRIERCRWHFVHNETRQENLKLGCVGVRYLDVGWTTKGNWETTYRYLEGYRVFRMWLKIAEIDFWTRHAIAEWLSKVRAQRIVALKRMIKKSEVDLMQLHSNHRIKKCRLTFCCWKSINIHHLSTMHQNILHRSTCVPEMKRGTGHNTSFILRSVTIASPLNDGFCSTMMFHNANADCSSWCHFSRDCQQIVPL